MNKTLIAAGIGASLLAAGCATSGRAYIGAGALASRLEPNTDAVRGVDVDESGSGGGNVLLGYDISNRFSLEGNYASLGEATLSPTGTIDYEVGGISALAYAFAPVERRARREGLAGYGRLGVGKLENSGDVAFEQENEFNVLVGLGLEYGFGNGLGLRGELVAHDRDVAYALIGLVYRIGDPTRLARPVPTVEDLDVESDLPADAASASASDSSSGRASSSADADSDGVADASDDCADTAAGLPADASGCDLYDGAVDGIAFQVGSDVLTDGAKRALDDIAATLTDFPATRIAIETHTDNTGSAADNLQLSRRRAISVAGYLIQMGVAGDRLAPRAFGESKPSAPNTTEAGRATNRRVEIRFLR